jgi:hypothetical protein
LYSAPVTIGQKFIVQKSFQQKSVAPDAKLIFTKETLKTDSVADPDISVIPDPGSYIKIGVQNKPTGTF